MPQDRALHLQLPVQRQHRVVAQNLHAQHQYNNVQHSIQSQEVSKRACTSALRRLATASGSNAQIGMSRVGRELARCVLVCTWQVQRVCVCSADVNWWPQTAGAAQGTCPTALSNGTATHWKVACSTITGAQRRCAGLCPVRPSGMHQYVYCEHAHAGGTSRRSSRAAGNVVDGQDGRLEEKVPQIYFPGDFFGI